MAARPFSSTSEPTETIPYPVYAEILRICDELQAENQRLRQLVDTIFEEVQESPLERIPTVTKHLDTLARAADGRLSVMPPYRYTESQLVVQMVVDGLHQILDQLRAEGGADD